MDLFTKKFNISFIKDKFSKILFCFNVYTNCIWWIFFKMKLLTYLYQVRFLKIHKVKYYHLFV